MGIGYHRFKSIQKAADSAGVMPYHKLKGIKSNNAMNGENALALKHHFDHLMQLGEVQATQVMAALVDGVQAGQTNCKDTVDMVYLPISMGY